MRKLLLAAATATVALGGIALSVPANAAYFGVGPVGVHVGPDYDYGYYHRWHHGWRGAYAYGGECRVIRDRVETPSGRVIFRTRRICD